MYYVNYNTQGHLPLCEAYKTENIENALIVMAEDVMDSYEIMGTDFPYKYVERFVEEAQPLLELHEEYHWHVGKFHHVVVKR